MLHSSNVWEPTRNSFHHPDICCMGVKHLQDENQGRENPGVRLRAPGVRGHQVSSWTFRRSFFAQCPSQTWHMLTAPSMISKWKDKHRKFVVMVPPAKSLTESWSGKELQNNAREGLWWVGGEASGSFIFKLQLIRQRGKEKARGDKSTEWKPPWFGSTPRARTPRWLLHF